MLVFSNLPLAVILLGTPMDYRQLGQTGLPVSVSNPAIATTLIGTASAAEVRKNVEHAESAVEFEMIAEVRKLLRPFQHHTFTRGRSEHRDPLVA